MNQIRKAFKLYNLPTQALVAAIRAALAEHSGGELAGLAVLTDVDMGTLDLMCVERDSEIHGDAELFFLVNEWEANLEMDFELSSLVGLLRDESEVGHSLDSVEGLTDSVDRCCLEALVEIKQSESARFSSDALFVYSHLEYEVEDYIRWFIELNGPAYEHALKNLLGEEADGKIYTPEARSETRVLTDPEVEFLAAASCGKESFVREQVGKMSPLCVSEALVLASRTGRVEVCKELIAAGADIGHVGYAGMTAVQLATQENRKRVLEYLANCSARDEKWERPPNLDRDILWILEVKIPADRARPSN